MARYMDRGHLMNILMALEYRELDDMKVIGFVQNQQTAILQYENEWFCAWDNGGEIGVEKMNTDMVRYAPMTVFGSPLNSLTMAYRLKQIFKNKDIDYDFKYDNHESEAFLNKFGRTEKMYEHFACNEEDENEEEAEM